MYDNPYCDEHHFAIFSYLTDGGKNAKYWRNPEQINSDEPSRELSASKARFDKWADRIDITYPGNGPFCFSVKINIDGTTYTHFNKESGILISKDGKSYIECNVNKNFFNGNRQYTAALIYTLSTAGIIYGYASSFIVEKISPNAMEMLDKSFAYNNANYIIAIFRDHYESIDLSKAEPYKESEESRQRKYENEVVKKIDENKRAIASEQQRLAQAKAEKELKEQLEAQRIRYEADAPIREAQAREKAERERQAIALKHQQEAEARVLAERQAAELKRQQDEAAEIAYQNSPEGRQVRAAKELAELEAQKMRQIMELELEKERKLAEIRRQAIEEQIRLTEEMQGKMRNL